MLERRKAGIAPAGWKREKGSRTKGQKDLASRKPKSLLRYDGEDLFRAGARRKRATKSYEPPRTTREHSPPSASTQALPSVGAPA
jgi:hypothetical protein